MAIDLKDTYSLLQAVERIKPAGHFLLDTFFPNTPPVQVSEEIIVEFKKEGRKLAPFVSRGARGVNQLVEGSTIQMYKPPKIGPKIAITPEMVEHRAFGENVFSTETPAERAEKLQADGLKTLQNMVINRKNKMAADILTTGKCIIEGYADDANMVEVLDTVDFGWTQNIKTTKKWTEAGAPILKALYGMSQQIQETAGLVPDTIVLGKNVFQYMIDNDEMAKLLAIPNRDNMALFNFAPQHVSPQILFNGTIPYLGASVYTYAETYTDDKGKAQPFVPENGVIMGVSGKGRQLHSAVTLIGDDNKFNTYAAQYVPYLIADKVAQQMELAMYSRCVLAPESVDDWCYMDTVTL